MANIKPIRYFLSGSDTVGLSEIRAGETVAWSDVEHPTTLSQSGITDVYTKTETNAAITSGNVNSALTANTVTNAAQPTITSVGDLTGLNVLGTATAYKFQANITSPGTSGVGALTWNDGDGTLDLGLKGGNVTLQLGQEQVVRVYNGTGSTLTDGQVVYVTGAQGQRPTVALANATNITTSDKTFGIVTETIANGAEGFITTAGLVNGLNTIAYAAGTPIWLGTTDGQITITKPTHPNHSVFVGWVIRSHAVSGSIFVHIQNGYHLTDLHDVVITSASNGQALVWDNANSRWINSNIAAANVTGLSTVATSGSYTDLSNKPSIPTAVSELTNDSGYLTSYTETDPIFLASNAASITGGNISNWNTAYGWGDHASAGYALTSAIPDSILDLGITDGTNGQVLTTNGSGTFSFTTVSGGGGASALDDLTDVTITTPSTGQVLKYNGSAWINDTDAGGSGSPGGSTTQIQYNNAGAFAGLSTLTTDGTNVTLGNITVTTSTNTFDRTDQSWHSGTSGNLGSINFGNIPTSTTYDYFSVLRNGKIRVGQSETINAGNVGTLSSVRRVGLSVNNGLINNYASLPLGTNDRAYGIAAQSYYDGGSGTNYAVTSNNANAFNAGNFASQVTNGNVAMVTSVTSTVNTQTAGNITTAVGYRSAYSAVASTNITNAVNYAVVSDAGATAGTYGNTYGVYMGPPVSVTDTLLNMNGSPPLAKQTGTPYLLYCNNQYAVSRVGSIQQADEVYLPTTHSGTTLALAAGTNTAHEVTLQANITELTFTGQNTTGSNRLTPVTLIFKQDATGGRTVTWPASTKFAGGVSAIGSAANEVSFASVMIYGGIYYVTIGTYS